MTPPSPFPHLISGGAKLAGVIGWPVSHSLSPVLHGFWLREYGIDGAYVPLPVNPDNLEQAVRGLAALGFQGVNATLPHKEKLVVLMDTVDDSAKAAGAVNTVVIGEEGTLTGSNTDGFGFLENLKQGAPDWRPDAGPAVILGAGGAARAVVHALAYAGVEDIRIINRTVERARAMCAHLSSFTQTRLTAHAWADVAAHLADACLLVNTTALGMKGQPPLEIDLDPLPGKAVVTDIVYTPLTTGLLSRAQARGLHTVDGLGMLLHQARAGFEAWFDTRPAVTPALRDALLARLQS